MFSTSKGKFRCDIIDADGCFYGIDTYHKRWDIICAAFGSEIMAHFREFNMKESSEHPALRKKIDETFARILADQSRVDTKSYSTQELQKQIIQLGKHFSSATQGVTYLDIRRTIINAARILSPETLGKLAILSNQVLTNHILESKHTFRKLLIAYGSNRQLASKELIYKNGTGNFAADLEVYVQHLQSLMPNKEIVLIKLTLRDIVDHLEIGENFVNLRTMINFLDSTNYKTDETKFMLSYLLIHYIRSTYGIGTFNFWDDDPALSVLYELDKIFAQYSECLPKRTVLNTIKYIGSIASMKTIIGSGPIDYCYRENILLLASLLFPKSENAKIIASSHVPTFLATRTTLKKMKSGLFVEKDLHQSIREDESIISRVYGTRIRPALREDVQAIAFIARNSLDKNIPSFFTRKELDTVFQTAIESTAAKIISPYHYVAVATSADKIVGFAMIYFDETFATRLQKLYVLREAQGKNVGSHLLMHCMQVALLKRSPQMKLEFSSNNHPAIPFFEKNGFIKTSDLQMKCVLKDRIPANIKSLLNSEKIYSALDLYPQLQ